MKKIFRFLVWSVLSLLSFIFLTNIWVVRTTQDRIYATSVSVENDVALVLGTSKNTRSGGENRFFQQRMNTAASLFRSGEINHILVSGDNRTKFYNEPKDMLNALGDLSIPDSVITLDYAGFRTLDSVVRAKEVFGQENLVIVTQQFHCYRSLFIADFFDIDAVAVAADDGGSIGTSLAVREVLARTAAVVDLYILDRRPKFL